MPKIEFISQAELAAVLASYNALGQTILDIRRRLEAGAGVEEGIYTADSNRGDPISAYDQPLYDFGVYGLDIETKGLPSGAHEDKPAAKGPELVPAPELPEWATETPHECEYMLEMGEGGLDCQSCQTIDLTRKEFLQLKMYLARLRGVQVPSEKPDGFSTSTGTCDSIWSELEPEEIAAASEAGHA
jgi:hypothetical protein